MRKNFDGSPLNAFLPSGIPYPSGGLRNLQFQPLTHPAKCSVEIPRAESPTPDVELLAPSLSNIVRPPLIIVNEFFYISAKRQADNTEGIKSIPESDGSAPFSCIESHRSAFPLGTGILPPVGERPLHISRI